jgi:hypothetical protein
MTSISAEKSVSQDLIKNLSEQRSEFFKSKQFPGESIIEWYSRIKFHSEFCEFGDDCEIILLQNFIAGIYSDEISDALCQQNHGLTLSKALEIALSFEKTVTPSIKKLRIC